MIIVIHEDPKIIVFINGYVLIYGDGYETGYEKKYY